MREFPGGPVVRTLRFHCQRHGFNPWSGNQDPTSHKLQGVAEKKKRIMRMDKEEVVCVCVCTHTHTHTHTHTNTMEYYSAIKKNEMMSFATTWTDLETVILSEVSQRKTNTT